MRGREVFEEASIRIKPLTPPTTFLADGDYLESDLKEIPWSHETDRENIPFLVVFYSRDGKISLSLMFLAEADQLPTPSSEIKGLLLLEKENIHWLCQESRTLEQYLNRGGKAIMNQDFDRGLVLQPFTQLRLLSRILAAKKD